MGRTRSRGDDALGKVEIATSSIILNRNFQVLSVKHNRCTTSNLFSDASEDSYGKSSYLRFLNGDGTVNCSFLVGKSKTSPLRPISIPRLELQAVQENYQQIGDGGMDRSSYAKKETNG